MAIVSVRNLTKAYGSRPPALVGVSFEVGSGVTGLLGPNGAGKSTWIQCVLGLLRDFQGDATVLGLDARKDRLAIRRRAGYMPEADSLLPGMSGITSTRYLAQLTGMPRSHALRRAHECLHYVGLTDALYRPGEEYSTGMRQRLKLAQALVHDPELLFLDEPVSGMDPEGREEFLSLIRELATQHGKHVVWSSHMLPDVQKVADGVIVLDRGRLLGSFRLEDLQGASGRWRIEAEGDVVAFAKALAERGATMDEVEAEAHVAATDGDDPLRILRIVHCPGGEAPALILAAAAASGTRVRALTPVVERLEDVFHKLLKGAAPAGVSP